MPKAAEGPAKERQALNRKLPAAVAQKRALVVERSRAIKLDASAQQQPIESPTCRAWMSTTSHHDGSRWAR
jgi:hypothetical protein